MTRRAKHVENLPDVIQKDDEVGEDDVVEFLSFKVSAFGRNLTKLQMGMLLPGDIDHFLRDVDSQAAPGTERCQEITGSASQLEDPHILRHMELCQRSNRAMISRVMTMPVLDRRRILIEERFPFLEVYIEVG